MNSDGDWIVLEWTWASVGNDLAAFVGKRWDLYEQSKEKGKRRAFQNLLRLPLAVLCQEYARILASRHTPDTSSPHNIIDLVKSRIENMRGRDCSLEQIARYAGYSQFRIAHLFKEQTGMTIGNYITQVRLQFLDQARVLDMKSKQIATELGFRSTTAYYNWHRKTVSKL